MKRRSFIKSSFAASAALASGGIVHASANPNQAAKSEKNNFKLKYAPHFGMFKHNPGDDLLDQIQFMADAGFTAMEDNGMKGREISMQEKIASKMGKLGMEMGVFVAHTIYWNEPSLTSGNQEKLDRALNYGADLQGRCAFHPEALRGEWLGGLFPWSCNLVTGGNVKVLGRRMPGFILRDHDISILDVDDCRIDHVETGVIEETSLRVTLKVLRGGTVHPMIRTSVCAFGCFLELVW